MGQYLDALPLGHTVEVSGPAGNLVYRGQGQFEIRSSGIRSVRHLGLIAGGTGITPMYQLISEILAEQQIDRRLDLTIDLLFGNRSDDDVLLREQIEQLSSISAGRFRFWFTVDRATREEWKYSQGLISESLIKEHLPPPSDDVLICICGPPAMIQLACVPHLDQLGYSDTMRFTF